MGRNMPQEVTANAAFDSLDQALCGLLLKARADADTTLVSAEFLTTMFLRLTGTLHYAIHRAVPIRSSVTRVLRRVGFA